MTTKTAERREMQRLRRQRDALLDRLAALVTAGNLGACPGMGYVEVHRDEIRKAERLVERLRAQSNPQPLAPPADHS